MVFWGLFQLAAFWTKERKLESEETYRPGYADSSFYGEGIGGWDWLMIGGDNWEQSGTMFLLIEKEKEKMRSWGLRWDPKEATASWINQREKR